MIENTWKVLTAISSVYILISWMHMKIQRGEWTRFECGAVIFIALIITITQVITHQ